jgi:hypothetical protein
MKKITPNGTTRVGLVVRRELIRGLVTKELKQVLGGIGRELAGDSLGCVELDAVNRLS